VRNLASHIAGLPGEAIRHDPDWNNGFYETNPRHYIYAAAGRCRSGSGSQLGVVMGSSLGIAFGQAMGSVEERQSPVRVFVNAHHGAREVRPQRDLQGEPAPFDGVAVADPAFLLDAQDVAHPAGAIGDEGAANLGRATAKAALWAGQ
jgi:hypothetical protein